ncbi:hypothetical protein CDD81_920 [Ophiocordyceps australis]|uniref:AAA+ ATPase domain-containing protein n=1 Tax=Ophiocordyceps australis TaxID=1399860 RepID=A0A2C5YFA6_9HYPO|nr:hypothetical protein CDD81_920 [Ophiocordyceps australis]
MNDGDGPHVFSPIPGAPSPQFALLNYLFPGFSVFSSAANASLGSTKGGSDASTYFPLFLALIAALVFFWPQLSGQLWGIVQDYFVSSVRIRPDDEIYNMVMLWISRQQFAQSSRHFLANTNINSRSHWVYRSLPGSDDSDDDIDTASESGYDNGVDRSRVRKRAIHYTPASGRYWFWYRGRLLAFERRENTDRLGLQSIAEREELFISCLGRSPQILKELLLEARRFYLERDERKTVIYRGNLGEIYWQRCMSRLNRPLSTVVLDHGIKQELLNDVGDYLRPATRRWYSNRGIPYRRGYLLYGPPGTGKSSLSLALAGYFRVKIYIVSLSSGLANEENIMSLFNDLPTRCIVLLEDIDTAGLTHTRDGAGAVAEHPPPAPPAASSNLTGSDTVPSSATTGRLSLSGLLNVLDGVASQEGRILIMTTNHIDKLDKALIRPGRVDMMIPFGHADSSMVLSMFRAIYSPCENEAASVDCPRSNEVANTESGAQAEEKPSSVTYADAQKRINALAQQFAEAIPESEFSPAEVQGLLLRHKRSPEAAIEAIDDWVTQMRKDKEEEAKRSEARAQERDKDAEPKAHKGPNQETLDPKL